MTAATGAKNLRQYKIRFYLIASASHLNIARKIKYLSADLKQIA